MSKDNYENYSEQDFENFKSDLEKNIDELLDKIVEAEVTGNKVWLENQFQIVVKMISDIINHVENNHEIMPIEQVIEMKYFIKKYIEVLDVYMMVAKRMSVELYLHIIDPEDLDKYR